jgi:hypothetical protein
MQNKPNLRNVERITLADTSRQRIQEWLMILNKNTTRSFANRAQDRKFTNLTMQQ